CAAWDHVLSGYIF
nr:immunoglobulin light chain junction region [Macaca mulatta]MPO07093.1 immunoglobulin light chain junction region [Macaca mulatta]MPO07108.1 immunoglobulin light chain junction region [Macaca mulatta]MPO07497.1 immunoglobulin light chain junction region [Macaca mulatta]MPO09354.1 immunoglobulin light chain junction region [Macaca mulatta]